MKTNNNYNQNRIEAILQAGENTGKSYTDKQVQQIIQRQQQLIWEGKRQFKRANEYKAREIEIAFSQQYAQYYENN